MRLALISLLLCLVSVAARADFDAAVLDYESGRYDTARTEFQMLSERGDPRGEFMLGAMYFYGKGVPQSDAYAAVWFHKAASQGHPGAQLAYGSLYIRGVGVTQDLIRAYMWLSLAADSNNSTLRQQAALLRSDAARLMSQDQVSDAASLARKWEPTPARLWIER